MKLCVSKSYGEKKVFEDFRFEIGDGEIVAVLGKSGVGKTTLLNILAGLTSYDGSIDPLPEKVGYIFQEPRLLPNLTIAENLRFIGGRDEDIDEILKKVELFELKNKRPKYLSGGEKQRVSIARAFLSNAKLLLLDEPFSSLDVALKIRLIATFTKLWQEKKPTVVFVTHDLDEALAISDRVIVLDDGKIVKELQITGGLRAYGETAKEKKELLGILLRG